ncbi:MAG: mechanosensitive ion channel family protein [Alphaproteobacteria bacterium]|nr:mechanosensitive ion channel family protein [Alphaproteobacteria bacterium]
MSPFMILATNLITAIAILILGWVGGNWANKQIRKIKKIDETLKSFFATGAKYLIFAIAIITVLQQFGVQTASLLAILGAAGLAIGLALQGTLSNVASGVMLLFLRPFNVGDTISCGNITGTVKSLGLFATELSTPDNVYIFVPNSNLWNADIQNFSRNEERRQDIVVGISYSDNIAKAMKAMESTLKSDKRVFQNEEKAPRIMVTGLGDFAVDLTARFWTSTADFWSAKVELTKAIKEDLDKAGITIPFPTRTIEMHESAGTSKKSSSRKAA